MPTWYFLELPAQLEARGPNPYGHLQGELIPIKKCLQNMRGGFGPIKFVRNPRQADPHGRIENIKCNGQAWAGPIDSSKSYPV